MLKYVKVMKHDQGKYDLAVNAQKEKVCVVAYCHILVSVKLPMFAGFRSF